MTEYHAINVKRLIKPVKDYIYSDMATTVELMDEGAGCFVEISQYNSGEPGSIRVNDDEWELIKSEVDQMLQLGESLDKQMEEQNEQE